MKRIEEDYIIGKYRVKKITENIEQVDNMDELEPETIAELGGIMYIVECDTNTLYKVEKNI